MRNARTLLIGLCVLSAAAFIFSSQGCKSHSRKASTRPSSRGDISGGQPKAAIVKSTYGKTKEGKLVDLYTLTNRNGMVAKIITYGGIVTELHVPDKNGEMADVV